MKLLPRFIYAGALLAAWWSFLPAPLSAAEQIEPPQRSFASPEDAIQALRAATEAHDKSALRDIFGPEFDHLQTGDQTQDEKNARKFAVEIAQVCKPVPEGENKIILEVGTNEWPMPIPLVKADGQWHFDTAAGKEEIICRHIGKDELHAIGVGRAYFKAQQQRHGAGAAAPSLAESQSVLANILGNAPQPYHGYYFRILTRQGHAAVPSVGFALVAYPAHWDRSGIMTFIVNQDGNVFERNLGEKTSRLARRMKEYNPDTDWKPVEEEGLWRAASER